MSASRADSSPDPATASDAIDDATATDAATDAAPFLLSPALHKPPALLPIARVRNELLHAIETWPVTIVVGQTGSGKTTQLPQFLLDAGWCRQHGNGGGDEDGQGRGVPGTATTIAVTQPRRLAAAAVAARVAAERGTPLGEEVGYAVRFEDVSSPAATRIRFLTDGLLLREALADPLLSRYAVVMVDEAHERAVATDLLLGVLKKVRRRRPDLRIVVSSATIQAEEFYRFFAGDGGTGAVNESPLARVVTVEGRAYPVDCLFLARPCEDYVERAIRTVLDIHRHEPPGDVLVFLTGREEILEAVERLADLTSTIPPGDSGLLALPLYAGLPTAAQLAVFEPAPPRTRKVVVATNVAETSVTLDGIVYVVDCGLAKLRALDPRSGVARLAAAPISRAAAAQRAGRAGRTRPGKCFRLYTRAAFDAAMPAPTPPEIARADLAPVLLQLKALGIDDLVRGFDFLTPPPAPLVARALELLFALGALDAHARLTRPLGLRMAELALDPMLAKVLLSAQRFGCTDEALAIAAMTSTVQSGGGDAAGSVWVRQDGGGKAQRESTRRAFAAEEGDHLTYLNVFVAFTTAPSARKAPAQWCHAHGLDYKFLCRAVSVRNQLRRYLERVGAVSAVTGRTETETLGRRGAASATAESVQRCLTTGLFAHAARMQPDGTFRPVARAGSPGGGGEVTLHAHPSSLMFNRKADWVVFGEAVQTAGKTFIRDITKVDKAWLLEYAPSYFESREGGDRVSRG